MKAADALRVLATNLQAEHLMAVMLSGGRCAADCRVCQLVVQFAPSTVAL